MGLKITQVDAFTDKAFSGNPAAVCILSAAMDAQETQSGLWPQPSGAHARLQYPENSCSKNKISQTGDAENVPWMQAVAREMNLSETAFLVPQTDGFNLRWFTPAVEVDLCGHATLASAHVLWEEGHLKAGEQARFHTRSGLLTADRQGDWIEMDFPAKREEPCSPPELLGRALGVPIKYAGKNSFDYLIEVDSAETVRRMKPDFTLLRTLPVRGVIVTSRSDSSEFDFVSRFFAPGAGVDEDPVTGSAHCCLGPYWSHQLGQSEFMAYQASARGGVVKVRVQSDRVILAGKAVTVLRGELV